uniref:Cyclic nucleotide-binding domain-containing protein n=1 Tax=Ascaris lumbricoides TaxID=6252 RepID=A0A9J2Q3S0_ASCLU
MYITRPWRTLHYEDSDRESRIEHSDEMRRRFSSSINQSSLSTNDEQRTPSKVVFDPRGVVFHVWTAVVTCACLCNFFTITVPVFEEVRSHFYKQWIALNLLCDAVFLIDMFVQTRISFFEDGVEIEDSSRTLHHYLFRLNRLAKCYRIGDFLSVAEVASRFPTVLIVGQLMLACLFIFHWNACAYYLMSTFYTITPADDTGDWAFTYDKISDPAVPRCGWYHEGSDCGFNESGRDVSRREDYVEEMGQYWTNRSIQLHFSNFTKKYALCMYWSALTITTLGEQPEPDESAQNVMEIFDTIAGTLFFAVIMGMVGDLTTNGNATKQDLRTNLDGAKAYMRNRGVDNELQRRVVDWFGYMLSRKVVVNEKRQLLQHLNNNASIPTRLNGQIALSIHVNAITKMRLFQDCEDQFLSEVIMRLKLRMFSPGDFVCQKGERCKELFIVKRGTLLVETENGFSLFTIDKECAYGELELFGKCACRQEFSVKSVGYSEVFVLTREDLWQIFEDFPEERDRLCARAKVLLNEVNQADSLSAFEEMPASSLEEKLNQILQGIEKLERVINENFENYKCAFNEIKQRLTRLESLCRLHRRDIHSGSLRHNSMDRQPSQQINQ